jgi:hypothetical protein
MIKFLDDKKICIINWCGKEQCEEYIKEKTSAKSLCKPIYDKYTLKQLATNCICGNNSIVRCLFGRSY